MSTAETLFAAWIWRAGLRRTLVNLHLELSRMVVNCPACVLPYPQNARAEVERRRQTNRSGEPARHTPHFGPGMQAFCSLSLFRAFGDGFVLEPLSLAAPRPSSGDVPLASTRLTCATYAPCPDTVDLSAPLSPCVRRSMNQRITTPLGYGQRYAWWRTCGKVCNPYLPNAIYFARTNTTHPGAPAGLKGLVIGASGEALAGPRNLS